VETFVNRVLVLLELLGGYSQRAAAQLAASGAIQELFECNLRASSTSTRATATRLLVSCAAEGGAGAIVHICVLIRQHVLHAIRQYHALGVTPTSVNELGLLSQLADHFQLAGGPQLESVLELVVELALEAYLRAPSNPGIAESVSLPCMRIFAAVSSSPAMADRMATPCRLQDGSTFTHRIFIGVLCIHCLHCSRYVIRWP
jgi:hypothetical protein